MGEPAEFEIITPSGKRFRIIGERLPGETRVALPAEATAELGALYVIPLDERDGDPAEIEVTP